MNTTRRTTKPIDLANLDSETILRQDPENFRRHIKAIPAGLVLLYKREGENDDFDLNQGPEVEFYSSSTQLDEAFLPKKLRKMLMLSANNVKSNMIFNSS